MADTEFITEFRRLSSFAFDVLKKTQKVEKEDQINTDIGVTYLLETRTCSRWTDEDSPKLLSGCRAHGSLSFSLQ